MSIITLHQLKSMLEAFVWDTRRSLLFLGCCVIIVTQRSIMSAIEDDQRTLLYHVIFAKLTEYILVTLLLLIAVFGCFAAFTGHTKSLKWFFYMIMFHYVIMGISLHSFIDNPGPSYRLEKSIKALELRMSMMLYKDWPNPGALLPNPSSKSSLDLNALQLENKCCGAYNPFDWDKYRPAIMPSQAYPSSCCSKEKARQRSWLNYKNGTLCHWDDIFTQGCMEVMYQNDFHNYSKFIFYLAFQFALSLLALTIKKADPNYNSLFERQPVGTSITEKGTVISMVSTPPAADDRINHSASVNQVEATFEA